MEHPLITSSASCKKIVKKSIKFVENIKSEERDLTTSFACLTC